MFRFNEMLAKVMEIKDCEGEKIIFYINEDLYISIFRGINEIIYELNNSHTKNLYDEESYAFAWVYSDESIQHSLFYILQYALKVSGIELVEMDTMLWHIGNMKRDNMLEFTFDVVEESGEFQIIAKKNHCKEDKTNDTLIFQLQNTKTNKIIATRNCSYNDDNEIKNNLNFLRICGLDLLLEKHFG